jgi:Fe-S-cluster-containing hydrogenase component 2
MCAKRCPVAAIDGGKNIIHIIDQDKCIKCGMCFEACPPRFGAVEKIPGEQVPPPINDAKRKIDRRKSKQ